MKTLPLALLALVLPSLAAADPVPKQIENIARLGGTWRGSGTMALGKEKAKIEFTWTCNPASAKFGVTCTLALKGIPGVATYEETDLFGYEPNSDTYHWFAVTNAGETHDHVAKNPGASSKIEFVYTGTQDGKAFKEVVDLELGKDEKSISVRSETFVAGQSTSVLEGKARK